MSIVIDGTPDAEPEPVKSHAQKRKTKRALKSNSILHSSPREPQVHKEAETVTKQQHDRRNSVWVGNLAYKTTSDALKQFFADVGEVTRVNMPLRNAHPVKFKGERRDNMGFAYVDFATPDAKVIAVTLSESHLDGRKLLIKDGSDFTGRPSILSKDDQHGVDQPEKGRSKSAQKILATQKQPATSTLFMGNLPFEATVDDIRAMVSAHRKRTPSAQSQPPDSPPNGQQEGWLRQVRLGTFEDSGKCKGWAFLDFTSITEATTALTNVKNHRLNGRQLVVEYASPEATRRGGAGQKRAHQDDESHRPKKKQKQEDMSNADVDESSTRNDQQAAHRTTADGKRTVQPPMRTRPKPGSALALARRESVAIVESKGNKIKFE